MANGNEKERLERIILINTQLMERTDDTSKCIGFQYEGVYVINPFFDETGRFEVEPRNYYGDENIDYFLNQETQD